MKFAHAVAAALLVGAVVSAQADGPARPGREPIRHRAGADCTSNSQFPGTPNKIECLNNEKNRIESKIDAASADLQRSIDKLRTDQDAKINELQRQINELTTQLNDRVTRKELDDRLANLPLTPGMLQQIEKMIDASVSAKTGNFLRSEDEVQIRSRVEHWFCAIWTGQYGAVTAKECDPNAGASVWILRLTKHNQ
ncbi:MAG: hypothetical protein KDJ30_09485 [Rhodoblastus sp.]|nr:hypothetical protein [Rhodoblastus sp.]